MAIQDNLPQLILCPLLDSYNVAIGDDVISTQYTNGPPRQRLDGVGRPHNVQVAFRHKAVHQEYIMRFWRIHRAKSFAMRLMVESTDMEWYQCWFDGPPQPIPLGGGVFEFRVGLIVKARPIDLAVDQDYIDAYIMSGGDISGYFNSLEKLVNVDLPDAVRSLNG